MDTTPYWINSAPIERFPPLRSDLKVDVLVVGAGITGISAAYLLVKAGFRIALIERERVASIDTGHTTAHLSYVTDDSLETLTKGIGRDHAQAVWDSGACAIDEIERIVNQERIECEYSRVPGYLHAALFGDGSKDERDDLKKEARLAQELGFDADFMEAVPHFGVPGVRFANQAKFHPRKYLRRLVEIIAAGGDSKIFEKSASEEFDAKKRRTKVNGHWISFDRVIIATHNPLVGLAEMSSAMLLQTKLSLYSSYVLGARIPNGSLPIATFWDTVDPYHYLRVDRHPDHDYAVFGGEDHKTGQVTDTEKRYAPLVAKLKKIAPQAEIDHRWSGQVIATHDALPYIGQNAEGQFIATGYSGNGITFGTTAAMMARDWVTGAKNPWADLYHVDRKLIKLGAWDYLRENADYPYYMIKDRLAGAEADSVRGLKPGDGMIVKSRGKKVAAYRDKKGDVHKVSAICTHMGCVVHWNSAEQTWDCPCHGSRFQPTGEVIAGPAEDPLGPTA
jgi:glycine/D-amino acid oxidase-like deaminating enzyme/nitrite reductase/ring-hydroxylating ferredoxin subunit